MQVNGDAPKWVSPHFGVSQCISMDLAADTDAAAADDARCGYTLKAHSHGAFSSECDSVFESNYWRSQSHSLTSIIDVHTTHSMRYKKMQSQSLKIA